MKSNLQEEIIAFDKSLDLFFTFYVELARHGYRDEDENSFSLLTQKAFLHQLALKGLCHGTKFKSNVSGNKLEVIDVFSMPSVLRSQFECYCCLNYVFIKPNGKEEKRMRYLLWEISGLKFRGRSPTRTKETRIQKRKEKAQTDDLIEELFNLKKVQKLNTEHKKKLKEEVRSKNWQLRIHSGKIVKTNWREMSISAGMKKSFFGNYYNYLSFNSHPTFISTRQLKTMYDVPKTANDIARNMLFISRLLSYFLILDYCMFSKFALQSFNELAKIEQLEILKYNLLFRDKRTVTKIIGVLNSG